ncbi:MAG TPA: sigma 54-interacting transcriptional regulator, partial [Vicinamibacterales bacterium]
TLRMQGLLLRFLETGEIQKVGAERTARAANVRVICATNRVLPNMIAQGLFREDLFYRINVIHLIVPPLRERREDIPLLLEHFLAKFNANAAAMNGNGHGHTPHQARRISPEALTLLCEYAWPGNVRQIENVIERMIVTGRTNDEVRVEDLPHEVRTPGTFGRPKHERRRTVADDLFKRLVDEREAFWQVVYPLYMNREITKTTVRELIHKGLTEARGNYKIVLRLFNMEASDYKRFLNFLRKHDCQLPFKEYR